MFRISTALVAATLLAGVANSDPAGEFTAQLEFDASLLTSEAGAADVLASLEDQAEHLCEVGSVYTWIDRDCVADVVDQAVEKIANANLTETYAGTIGTL